MSDQPGDPLLVYVALADVGYREALMRLGLEVTTLPPDDELPDSCFVQNLAIVLNGRACSAGR